jgi:6-phosphogluconolactonase
MLASRVHWTPHDSSAALCRSVVQVVADCISASVAVRGQAVIALPGGKTPRPMFEALAALPLPWTQVTVIPGDDRLVPLSDTLSNTAVLQRLFTPAGARVLPLTQITMDRYAAGDDAERLLHTLPWPLDLVWLGLGGDGHTASIFPGPDYVAALDADAARRATGVRPDPLPPEAPVDRVTLTGSAIAAARQVLLVCEGASKREVLQRALRDDTDAALPIAALLRQRAGITLVQTAA